eukprot:TRINITY_DN3335_c0_g1_i1.p1 TRINITY_DN3335_c0_g1~~TRINITY_DN3335_c0_g1_i1.p1  ORF type:complete len:536 (+),score=117.60 TRINITY_DN3335_c0_g1_i1:88-1608(+)
MISSVVMGLAAAANQPNLLLLFPDQWRYDWDGFHTLNTGELPLNTPTLHQLAARGTRFTQAYVPAPVCAPSRSCLASGREYDEAGVPSNFQNDYPISQTTFYTLLKDAGYHTMTTGKDDLTKATQLGYRNGYQNCSYCKDGDGLYHQAELGFSDGLRYSGKMDVVDTATPHEMYGYYLSNQTTHIGTKELSGWDAHVACMKGNFDLCTNTTFYGDLYEDTYTGNNAVELLKRKPSGKPWFMHVSFPGPHPPFLVTAPMHDSVAGRVWPGPTDYTKNVSDVCFSTGEPQKNFSRCNYGAEIEHLDSLFKQVIDTVEEMGELDNTIICATSDHGEMLYDHGDTGKTMPWQGSSSVPLICAGPGISENVTVGRPVATLDVSGTFLDFAGAKPVEGMTTVSFKSLLQKGTDYKKTVNSGLNKWRMVVQDATADDGVTKGSFKYICCEDKCPGTPSTGPQPKNGWMEMLINVSEDLFDMHDLAPQNPNLVAALRAELPPAYAAGCAKISEH